MFHFSTWLHRKFARTGTAHRPLRRQQKSLRPQVEALEQRVVPVLSATNWTPIGPSPIANGQLGGNGPVAGRVTGLGANFADPNILYASTAGGGVWKTTDGGVSWHSLTDSLKDGNGNPLPLFMGAIGVTNVGTTDVIYAGTGEANNSGDSYYGEGILISVDGGTTWKVSNPGGIFTGNTVSKIVPDALDSTGKTAYAAICGYGSNGSDKNTGIWKTTDGGTTWTNTTAAAPNNLSSTAEWSDLVQDRATPGVLYAAEGDFFGSAGNGVYKTTDGGGTWNRLANAPSGSTNGRYALAISPPSGVHELVVVTSSTNGGTFGQLQKFVKSTDDGATFTDITSNVPNFLGASGYGQGWYNITVAIESPNASINYLYAGGSDNGGSNGNIESFDGGTTWQSIVTDRFGNGPHSDDHAVTFDALGNLIDGNDGGIFRLDTPPTVLNQKWDDLNGAGLQITQFTGIAVDPTTLSVAYGGTQDNGTDKFTGTTSWTQLIGGDGGITRVDPTNHNTIYQEFTGVSLDVSFNGGTSFSAISSGIVGTNSNFYAPYVLDSSGDILFGSQNLNLSKDHGTTWTQIGSATTNGFNPSSNAIDSIAVAPTTNNVVYVAAGGSLFVTQNATAAAGSVTWTSIPLPGTSAGSGRDILTVDPSVNSGGTAYAVVDRFNAGGHRVFKTTNFGTTWVDITGPLLNTPVDSVAVSPDGQIVYVGTDVGVYFTLNNGAAWSVLGAGLPNTQVIELESVPSQSLIAAGTHGRGMWEILTSQADVSIVKTGPATAVAGSRVTYTLTVTDNGPNDASTVAVTDVLPAGETLVSENQVTGSDVFTNSSVGNTASFTIGLLPNGHTDTFQVVALVAANQAAGVQIANTATVSTTSPDTILANNTSTMKITVTTIADLNVTATGPATGTAGANLTYTITVVNNGPSDAQTVSLGDVAPAGTTLLSEQQINGPDTFGNISTATTAQFQINTLPAGHTDTFQVVVHSLSSDATGTLITNVATGSSATPDDGSPNDESSTVKTTLNTIADLNVTGSGPGSVIAGTNLTYVVTVSNRGPSDALTIDLTDVLPASAVLVSERKLTGTDAFQNVSSGNTAEFTLARLTANHTDTFQIVARALPSDVLGSTVRNTIAATSSTPDDGSPNDESVTVATTVTTQADLNLTNNGPANVPAGGNLTYTVTLVNNGPSDAQNVSVTDAVPAGTVLVSEKQLSGPETFTDNTSGGNVLFKVGAVAAGSTDVFQMVVLVPHTIPGGSFIFDTATAASSTPDDGSPNDETSSATTTVVVIADLTVTTSGPATVTAGTNLTYTISVANNGPSDSQNVSLTDAIPAGTTLVTAGQVGGSVGYNNATTGNNVRFTAGSPIVGGEVDLFKIVVAIPSNLANNSVIHDTAIAVQSTPDDGSPNDETYSYTTTVLEVADLTLTGNAPAKVNAGANLTYTFAIANAGPSDAQNTLLTDVAPTGTTLVSARQLGGSDVFTNQSVGNTAILSGTIKTGNTDNFLLVFHALSSDAANSTLLNTATASSSASDPNTGNNSVQLQTGVNVLSGLSVAVRAPSTQNAGTNLTYTITVANQGPSDAQTVALSDILPAGTTLVSEAQTGGSDVFTDNTAGNTVNFQAATVTGGNSDVFSVVVSIPSNTVKATVLSDTAAVSTVSPVVNPKSETASVNTTVSTVANLQVTLTAPATVTAGLLLTYTITLVNNGPSDAQNVNLNDTIPAGTRVSSEQQLTGSDGFTNNTTGSAIQFGVATVPAGSTDTFQVVLQALSSAPDAAQLNNVATVASDTVNSVPANMRATSSTLVHALADVSVTTTGPATATAGSLITYTITVVNHGPSDAQTPTLTDIAPSGTLLVSEKQLSGSDVFIDNRFQSIVSFQASSLKAGNTDTFQMVVSVPSSDANNLLVRNTATLGTTTTDPTPNDQSFTLPTVISAIADVNVAMTGPATAVAGQNLTYTITVANTGPSDAQSVTLTDALPSGASLVSESLLSGLDNFQDASADGAVIFSAVALPAGHHDTFQVIASVASSNTNTAQLTNTASATSATPDDGSPNDESATLNTSVTTAAELTVTGTGPATVIAGTQATYTFTVTNSGPSDAQLVTLTDQLPAGVTLVSVKQLGIGGDVFRNLSSANTVSLQAPSVLAGNTDSVQVVLSVPSSFANNAVLANTMSASSPTADPTPSDSNNVATVRTTVTALVDLSITQTGPTGFTEGQAGAFTFTIANAGPSDATNVMLTDAIPAGTVFQSTSFLNYSDTATTTNLGTLTAGGSITGTIVLATPNEGTFSNRAAVTSDAREANPANNTTTSPVLTIVDPQITLSGGLGASAALGADAGQLTLATFTDPAGASDTDYTATIYWGDASPLQTATMANGGIQYLGNLNGVATFAVQVDHTFNASGTLTPVISVQHAGLLPVSTTDTAVIAPDVVVTGTSANDTLTVARTAGAAEGTITYVLNGGKPVTLYGAQSFTFNALDGNDTMIVDLTNGTLVAGSVHFAGGAGTNTLIVDAAGGITTIQTGMVTVSDPQAVTFDNIGGLTLQNTSSANGTPGPDTTDRPTAYPGLTPAEHFVQSVYLDELGRPGAKPELDSWLGLLSAPGGQQAIATTIGHSLEARDNLVRSWYATYLGRTPVAGEEMGWASQMVAGRTEEQVLGAILGGGEFFARAQGLVASGTANQRYVQALYQSLFQRTAAASEVAGWVSQMPSLGTTGLAGRFLTSAEYRYNLVEAYYVTLLHRPSDPNGIRDWVFSNLSAEAIRLAIEGSAEFYVNG